METQADRMNERVLHITQQGLGRGGCTVHSVPSEDQSEDFAAPTYNSQEVYLNPTSFRPSRSSACDLIHVVPSTLTLRRGGRVDLLHFLNSGSGLYTERHYTHTCVPIGWDTGRVSTVAGHGTARRGRGAEHA